MTTVLLAHGHPAVRGWIRDALVQAPNVEFVAEASEGEEVLSLIEEIRWHVVLVARTLSRRPHGIEIVERVQEAGLGVAVLILGVPDDDGLLCRLWRAGAAGCISEDAQSEVIVEAVRAAASGRPLWTPEQIARVECWWDEVGSRLKMLTLRERQVPVLVAEGLSNRQIALRLVLSENTVETHVRNVLNKLRVSRRLEAAMLAAREMNVNQPKPKITDSGDDTARSGVI